MCAPGRKFRVTRFSVTRRSRTLECSSLGLFLVFERLPPSSLDTKIYQSFYVIISLFYYFTCKLPIWVVFPCSCRNLVPKFSARAWVRSFPNKTYFPIPYVSSPRLTSLHLRSSHRSLAYTRTRKAHMFKRV